MRIATLGAPLALIVLTGLSSNAAAIGSLSVTGVSADDPLFFGIDPSFATNGFVSVGPNIGQCHVKRDASVGQTGAHVDATCQNPGTATATAGGPVYYGAVVLTLEPAAGCAIGSSPSISFGTIDDTFPFADPLGPVILPLPSPQTGVINTVRWLVAAPDADLYGISFTVSEICGASFNSFTQSWMQRA